MNFDITSLAPVAISLFAAAVLVRFLVSAYSTTERRPVAGLQAAPVAANPAFSRTRLARLQAGSRRSSALASA